MGSLWNLNVGILLVIFLSSAVRLSLSVSCDRKSDHSPVFGHRVPGDDLLYMDHPKESSKLLRVTTYDVKFPTPSDQPGNITYIEVVDQKKNKNGACAFITRGGVGNSVVEVHVKSQRGYGIDSIVRIYGIRQTSRSNVSSVSNSTQKIKPSPGRNSTGRFPIGGRNSTSRFPVGGRNSTSRVIKGRDPISRYPVRGRDTGSRNRIGGSLYQIGGRNSTSRHPVKGRDPISRYPVRGRDTGRRNIIGGRNSTGRYPTVNGRYPISNATWTRPGRRNATRTMVKETTVTRTVYHY